MSYSIMRTGKLKTRQKTTAAAEHNFRLRPQANIDEKETHRNKVIHNPIGADITKPAGLANAIAAKYERLKVQTRKNSVWAQEFVISASPEFFKGKDSKEIEAWADAQNAFMVANFGENVAISVLHLDETTPHLHFVLTTEEKKTRKHKGGGSSTGYALNARRWNPQFLRDLHTRHAEWNQKQGYDLKRGQEGSTALHRPVKEFYKEAAALEAAAATATTAGQKNRQLSKMVATLADWLAETSPEMAEASGRIRERAKSLVIKEPSPRKAPGFK